MKCLTAIQALYIVCLLYNLSLTVVDMA